MNKHSLHLFFLLSMLLSGCTDVLLPEAPPEIVVEGWIENDKAPIVILTTSVPITEEFKDVKELEKYLIKWGKVSVSDGNREVVLVGKRNKDYYPPYIYTTSHLRGEPGRTYYLKVEYSGRTVTASTTIPVPKKIDDVRVLRTEKNDSLYTIVGELKDNRETKDQYKIFTLVKGQDTYYSSSFLGLINDETLKEETTTIQINNNVFNINSRNSTYFTKDDVVSVRFCSLDEDSYNYWNDYDELVSFSRNPFFPITSRIRSNISGGLGYWAGYGSTYYTINIPDSLANGCIRDK